jgi:hypothetical protein
LEEQKEYFRRQDSAMDAQLEEDRKFGEQDGVQDKNCYPQIQHREEEEEYKFGENELNAPKSDDDEA